MVNDLCEYEKRRMENVKRNYERLAELGLEAPMRKAIKKRRVTAPKVRERRGSHGHIEKRVFVVWNAWEPYTGMVTKHDPFKSNSLFVEYDDGEKQWEAAEDVRPIDEFIVLE
eukprot:7387941-Prymnesium_polylepis.1